MLREAGMLDAAVSVEMLGGLLEGLDEFIKGDLQGSIKAIREALSVGIISMLDIDPCVHSETCDSVKSSGGALHAPPSATLVVQSLGPLPIKSTIKSSSEPVHIRQVKVQATRGRSRV